MFYFNLSQGLWWWLKGSNMYCDVIVLSFGVWVNGWGLVYGSPGCIPGMRSPTPWIFPSLSFRLSRWFLSRTHSTSKRREKFWSLCPLYTHIHTHAASVSFRFMVTHDNSLPSPVAVWTSVSLLNLSHRHAAARHAELMIKSTAINKDITLTR